MDTFRELFRHVRADLTDHSRRIGSWFDAIVAPAIFVGSNAVAGPRTAATVALSAAGALVVWRLARRRPIRYAAAGVGGTVLAAAYAAYTNQGEAYFIPAVVTGAVYSVGFLISVAAGRPAVALISQLTRGWPALWYRQKEVRPAYSETTVVWAVFFGSRAFLQWRAVADDQIWLAAAIRIGGGWPAIIALIIATQLYGSWRLRHLGGPSVSEWVERVPPPWEGQRVGF